MKLLEVKRKCIQHTCRSGSAVLPFFCFVFLCLTASCVDNARKENKESSWGGLFLKEQDGKKEQVRQAVFDPQEYASWYNAHKADLVATSDTLDYSYRMAFIPKEVEVVGMCLNDPRVEKSLDSLLYLKSGFLQFDFSIEPHGNKQRGVLKQVALSTHGMFEMQQDFSLVLAGDTVSCAWAEPIKEYMQVGNTMVYRLGFETKKSGEGAQIVYRDRMLGTGTRRFIWAKGLEGLPQLKNEHKK